MRREKLNFPMRISQSKVRQPIFALTIAFGEENVTEN